MSWEQVQSMIRSAMKIGGGVMIGQAGLTENKWTAITALVTAGAGVVWSFLDHSDSKKDNSKAI